jgi:hypothetical protein
MKKTIAKLASGILSQALFIVANESELLATNIKKKAEREIVFQHLWTRIARFSTRWDMGEFSTAYPDSIPDYEVEFLMESHKRANRLLLLRLFKPNAQDMNWKYILVQKRYEEICSRFLRYKDTRPEYSSLSVIQAIRIFNGDQNEICRVQPEEDDALAFLREKVYFHRIERRIQAFQLKCLERVGPIDWLALANEYVSSPEFSEDEKEAKWIGIENGNEIMMQRWTRMRIATIWVHLKGLNGGATERANKREGV